LAIPDSLGEVISKLNYKQFRAAETEKFAHATFFFNGQRHDPWPGEERAIIASPSSNMKNYEDIPEMSAYQVADAVVARITEQDDKFIFVNFANCDMVGHTGSLEATRKAILSVDECLHKIYDACYQVHALMMITADHGNCEAMIKTAGEADKEHSANPVPLILVADTLKLTAPSGTQLDTLAAIPPSGILADIAPTVLHYLGIEKPPAMTGSVLEF
jgi:2,3-bisphosphoglycerate-independent phosphoglycerate mutase